MIHVGFIIHDLALENGFFRTILGFRPYWFGGMRDYAPTWNSLQVPNGTDWLEFMIVGTMQGRSIPADMNPRDVGMLKHFSLAIANAEIAYTFLRNNDRLAGQEKTPKITRDAKWQLNLPDSDGTRAETMEFQSSVNPAAHSLPLPTHQNKPSSTRGACQGKSCETSGCSHSAPARALTKTVFLGGLERTRHALRLFIWHYVISVAVDDQDRSLKCLCKIDRRFCGEIGVTGCADVRFPFGKRRR
jgi:hypothetical protein